LLSYTMSALEAISESNDSTSTDTPNDVEVDEEKTRTSYKNQSHDDDDDLVIESEDEEEGETTLNLTGQSLESIPLSLCKNKSASSIHTLILTKNKLRSLKGLEHFQSITTLQLDRNGLQHIDDFPKLPMLKTLWLNNNKLKNLHSLLLILKKQCPHLEYLSLLFNPICPTMDPSTEQLHTRYRLTVIYHLPSVTFLDTEAVQMKERQEALKRGKFLIVAKPSLDQLKEVQDVVEEEEEDVAPYKNVKPAAFLGKGRIKYDGRESEGNRFILNQDL